MKIVRYVWLPLTNQCLGTLTAAFYQPFYNWYTADFIIHNEKENQICSTSNGGKYPNWKGHMPTDGLEGVKEWKPVCAHKRGEA